MSKILKVKPAVEVLTNLFKNPPKPAPMPTGLVSKRGTLLAFYPFAKPKYRVRRYKILGGYYKNKRGDKWIDARILIRDGDLFEAIVIKGSEFGYYFIDDLFVTRFNAVSKGEIFKYRCKHYMKMDPKTARDLGSGVFKHVWGTEGFGD